MVPYPGGASILATASVNLLAKFDWIYSIQCASLATGVMKDESGKQYD